MFPRHVSPISSRFLALLLSLGLGFALAACETEAKGPAPAPAAGELSSAPDRIPVFELEDQLGTITRYDGRSERPVALFASRRQAADMNLAWDRWILPRYGESIDIHPHP